MILLIECVIVGLYSYLIHFIVEKIISNLYLILFFTGFLKHFLGYMLNIQTFYCNYGNACKSKNKGKKIAKYSFSECIIEGLLYLFIGTTITYNSFIIGFSLHFIFELLNIHKYFCNTHCISIK